jgi:predicted transcriptional regulator
MDMTQDTPDDDVHGDTPQAKSQFYTQGLESQRVPLEVIRAMAPQTDRSDIIVSIHPEPADLIANGSKNHEFRNYKIPNTVSRIWIYITRPICELRYMATIGPAKQPGAIDDDSGVGNREFNAQAGNYKYKFAYELLQVYQLNNPVSLEMMKEKGWVESPPQKYVYIPPAVVGQLLGNLRCALFDDGPQSDQEESHRILSTPQEIEDQLRSDIIHSTQMQSEVSVHNEIVLSSQDESSKGQQTPTAKTTSDNVSARPQLPATRTPASARRMPSLPAQPSLPTLPSRKEANAVRPSQATTASEPSSPVISPDKSIPRPVLGSSGPSFPDYGDSESPVRVLNMQQYSLGSSQIRLPESLLVDDVRPPPVVWDSDEEDSDGQLA